MMLTRYELPAVRATAAAEEDVSFGLRPYRTGGSSVFWVLVVTIDHITAAEPSSASTVKPAAWHAGTQLKLGAVPELTDTSTGELHAAGLKSSPQAVTETSSVRQMK
jgi:hypothetical protein